MSVALLLGIMDIPGLTPADILYYDLLGVVVVFAADVFHLWEPWANALTRVVERVRARRMRPR